MDINEIHLNVNKENMKELTIKGVDNKLYKLIIIKENDEIILKLNIIDDIFNRQYQININLKQFYNINKIFRENKSINDIYSKYFNNIKEKDIIINLNNNKIELKYKEEINFILEPKQLNYENIIMKLCDKIDNINSEMNKIKIENNNLKNIIINNDNNIEEMKKEIKDLKIKNEEEIMKKDNEIKEIMNKKYDEIIELINNNKNIQKEEYNNKLPYSSGYRPPIPYQRSQNGGGAYILKNSFFNFFF